MIVYTIVGGKNFMKKLNYKTKMTVTWSVIFLMVFCPHPVLAKSQKTITEQTVLKERELIKSHIEPMQHVTENLKFYVEKLKTCNTKKVKSVVAEQKKLEEQFSAYQKAIQKLSKGFVDLFTKMEQQNEITLKAFPTEEKMLKHFDAFSKQPEKQNKLVADFGKKQDELRQKLDQQLTDYFEKFCTYKTLFTQLQNKARQTLSPIFSQTSNKSDDLTQIQSDIIFLLDETATKLKADQQNIHQYNTYGNDIKERNRGLNRNKQD